ncbi:MAG: DUF5985 family protein [Gemmatimonadaceae bacterium]
MILFIGGLLVMGYGASALFFARFWRETGDRLFLLFSAAFGLLALQRLLITTVPLPPHDIYWHYVIRLAAFLLILIAIVDKNRRR